MACGFGTFLDNTLETRELVRPLKKATGKDSHQDSESVRKGPDRQRDCGESKQKEVGWRNLLSTIAAIDGPIEPD